MIFPCAGARDCPVPVTQPNALCPDCRAVARDAERDAHLEAAAEVDAA